MVMICNWWGSVVLVRWVRDLCILCSSWFYVHILEWSSVRVRRFMTGPNDPGACPDCPIIYGAAS
jgi:hypothetical protein